MIKMAICEDNPLQCDKIEKEVQRFFQQEVLLPYTVSKYHGVEDFLEALLSVPFRIVFIDIELGEQERDGITIGGFINKYLPNCQIIYITNHMQYVSKVYEVEHSYFILKENLEEYLPYAIRKVLSNIEQGKKEMFCFENINGTKELLCISQKEIVYFERDKRITHIFTDKKEYITKEKLDSIEERLLHPPFVRCHRSFIMNFAWGQKLDKLDFTCKDNRIVPVSRSYYSVVKKLFMEYLMR